MGKINKLDSSVYNRLAAGEVVENPASIVKELVENSIDSNADNIYVYIENGGIKSITIIDNGTGIDEDDLPLTVLSHATSKLSTAEDLESISTLGFRGEALASIAAISNIEIKSKSINEETGHYIRVKGGEVLDKGISSISVGTQVTMTSLFYNTPVRYKFLKSEKNEENNITKLMIELILANPNIAFHYYIDGNQELYTNGTGIENALYEVYGKEVFDNLIKFSETDKNYSISGYIGRPATNAIVGNKTKQTFIVNERIFYDNTISAVIQNAYGEHLMKRTFPIIVLDIVMPFTLVDVNVHPNKKEVRFAEPNFLNGLIYKFIKNALDKDDEDRKNRLRDSFLKDLFPSETVVAPMNPLKSTSTESGFDFNGAKELLNNQTKPTATYDIEEINKEKSNIQDDIAIFNNEKVEEKPIINNYEISNAEYNKFFINNPEIVKSPKDIVEKPTYTIIGQAFKTYIIIEYGDDLYFIDQHAAHERVMYDKLLQKAKERIEVQDLLIPYEKKVDYVNIKTLEKNLENLKKLGFYIEIEKESIVKIYSVPSQLLDINLESFINEIVSNDKEINKLSDVNDLQHKFATMACKSAIKGNEQYSKDEIEYIVKYFFENNMPLQCPHGRPTMFKMRKTDLEKNFGRIVK